MPSHNDSSDQEYVAFVDQDEVTDEVRDIALKYDPLNRSGREGFHLTEDDELHIDDSKVMAEHKLIEKKIPNDAIRIVPLPAETGQLVHQYGDNGFRLYDLPAPEKGSIVGLVGPNGIGKSTALRVLAGDLIPNFGSSEGGDWEHAIDSFRGTTLQTHLERLADGEVETVHKHQRVDRGLGAESKTVRELLTDRADDIEPIVDELDLCDISDRRVRDLSGGERQRVAIGRALLGDADLYLFDEPTSFLDVGQRVSVARTIRRHVQASDAAALVVEHDLATLDLLSDGVHVIYGDPGGFGVVSERLSTRAGINQFLEGYLEPDNVQIRRNSIEFPSASDRETVLDNPVLEYPALSRSFEGFDVSVESGQLHAGETVGIVGPNALGKTTFVKLLAGAIEPDEGSVPDRTRVSYKPQYISPDGKGTVRQRLSTVADLTAQSFRTRVADSLELESLYDRPLDALSGGELQRVGVGLCLAREADLYLLDEPSAFLDVERRVSLADHLRRFGRQTGDPVLVVDHDLFVINRLADRLLVFEGRPGEHGRAGPPQSLRSGMNSFLADLDITFRRDARSGRPRVNKPGSQLDREQKREGEYYYG